MRTLCFWDFIIKNVKLKHELLKNFERETNFSSNKNNVSRRVKVDILRCSWWTIRQMRMQFLGFYTKCVKFKKGNSEKTIFGEKSCFSWNKKSEQLPVCCNYEPLHSRNMKRSEYFVWWILIIRNICKTGKSAKT